MHHMARQPVVLFVHCSIAVNMTMELFLLQYSADNILLLEGGVISVEVEILRFFNENKILIET